ncbi:MAG: hypothetical protein WC947_07755 [Elusimicrobiota bacterium]
MAAISIVLVLAIFVIHFKTIFLFGLFTGQWQGVGDVTLLYYPSRFFFGNSLRIGEFPLWNNNMFLGFPIHAEGQGGFFYPPNILFAIFPQWIAYNYVFLMHLFLGGFFMYLFLKEIKLKKIPSLLSSFIFIFSGFFACHAEHMNLFNACIWIPLGFLFILKKQYLHLSLIFALQLLTGFPQIAFYSGIILFFWQIFNTKKVIEIFKYFLSTILGILIAFCQVLPTIELIPHSIRSKGINPLDMFSWGYYPKDILLFFYPYIFGNPVIGTYMRNDSILYENCAFVGIMTILLVVVGLMKNKKERFIRFFFILFLAVISFLLVFPVIFKIVSIIPIFNFFRLPQRFLVFVVFAFAVISGYGFQSLRKFRFLVFFAVSLELVIFSSGYNKVIDIDYFSLPSTVKFLKQDKENIRVAIIDEGQKACIKNYVLSTNPRISYFSQRDYLNYIPPNMGIYFNIPMMNIYSPLSIVNESELLKLAEKNVKYILATENLKNKNYSLIKEIGLSFKFPTIKIYKNSDYISPAFLTNKNIKKIRSIPLVIKEHGNQKIIIEKNITSAGEVVLSDLNYPGWRVYTDGIKSKIIATEFLTRSVAVAPASKNIIFIFMPWSFMASVLITIILIFILSGFLIYEKNTCH